MPELRRDPIINRWVIVARERAKRPLDFPHAPDPPRSGFCPFCPGHEEKTPKEILACPALDPGATPADWILRVVPNKFPALVQEGVLHQEWQGLYEKMTGLGTHEVLIETPVHDQTFAEYSSRHVEKILWACRERIYRLSQEPDFQYILIFKNHGVEAGASLDHPHSQIIALPIVPQLVSEEMNGALGYFDTNGRCVYCDMIRQEMEDPTRIVLVNEKFLALEPYASRFPFETWILPLRHDPHFVNLQDEHLLPLAAILRDTLWRIKQLLQDPPYNFMLHTSPCREASASLPHFHWHLEITPKLTRVAGFEWGTGFYINPMPPELAAAYLRDCGKDQPGPGWVH
ncbi:MAG: galactose-1-phosphate uridylyltransferase [bacterium]